MKFLRNVFILGVILLAGLLAGDYFNLPLWPMDWFKTSYPVEVHLVMDDLGREKTEQIITQSKFYEVFLTDVDGNRFRELPIDNNGVSRCVIQEGRYGIDVLMTVVNEGDWSIYRSRGKTPGTPFHVNIDRGGLDILVPLQKETNLADQSKQKILKAYLQEGDILSALVLASDISQTARKDIEELAGIVKALEGLPVDAYNSKLSRLKRISEIMTKYGVTEDKQILHIKNDFINVHSRYLAINRARNNVVESYIQTMNEFERSGRLMSVLQEWKQLMGNDELSENRNDLPDNMKTELSRFEDVVSDVVELLPGEIEKNFDQGIESYEEGNLKEAREKLTRLLTFIRNLKLEKEYPEKHSETIEYLQDIEIIAAANHAVRNDNLERALMLFDMIAHQNTLVRERIAETQRFLQMKTGRGSLNE